MTRAMRFAFLAAGLGLGVFSMAVARGGAGYSFGGSSAFARAAELVAGDALLAVGFTAWMRPRQARLGAILVAASFAWFLLEWSNPAAGSVVFTTGLVLYAAAPPLVAHADARLPRRPGRLVAGRLGLALGYAGSVLVLGLLAAAVFDPASEGCAQCPRNLLLAGGGSAYGSVSRAGVYLGLTWSLLVILVAGGGLTWLDTRAAAPGCSCCRCRVRLPGPCRRGLRAQPAPRVPRRRRARPPAVARRGGRAVRPVAGRRLGLGAGPAHPLRARPAGDRAGRVAPAGGPARRPRRRRDPSLVLAYPLAGGRLADARCGAVELAGEIDAPSSAAGSR